MLIGLYTLVLLSKAGTLDADTSRTVFSMLATVASLGHLHIRLISLM